MKTINTIWMKPLLMVCGAFVLALNLQAQTPACSVEHRQLWICAGDDFMFHGKKVPVPGTYSDTLKDVTGCDSVILYDVNVTATFHWVDYANISDQSKFPWHGEEYTQSGIYEKVYKSIHDCDSTYELHLTVWPTYHFYDTLAVCENAFPYPYHSIVIDAPGDYSARFLTTAGYDSIYYVHITSLPVPTADYQLNICEDEVATLPGGRVVKKSGIYYDTIPMTEGCDSVYRYIVNRLPKYFIDYSATFAEGRSYTWRNKVYDKAGVYFDSLRTEMGCDSIYRLTLTEQKAYLFAEDTTICERDLPWLWRGRLLYKAGEYEDVFQTTLGADSIYRLNLTVMPTGIYRKFVQICDGDSYTIHGQAITEPGEYRDTILTQNGCDSICIYVISKANSYLFEQDASLHGQPSYKWRDQVYTRPGTYEEAFKSIYGCDSIYRLVLHENIVYYTEERDTICASELPYAWRGRMLYNGGTFYDSIASVYNTDSVFRFYLTVYDAPITELQRTVCQGETFLFKGQPITESGVYSDTLKSVHGCDSIVRMVVNIVPTYRSEITVVTSDKQPYEWRGQQYDVSGTYEDVLHTAAGCDSVFVLNLTVYPTYEFLEEVAVCAGESYTWRGKPITHEGVYTDKYKTINGMDSIYRLNFAYKPTYYIPVRMSLCQGDTILFGDSLIAQPGMYLDTLIATDGCDSIISLIVNRADNYMINQVGALCASGNTNSPAGSNNGGVYEWRGQLLTEPGIYYDSLRSSTGCDSIYRLMLNPAPTYNLVHQVMLCPNETFTFKGQEYTAPAEILDTHISSTGCDSTWRIVINAARSYVFRDTAYLRGDQTILWHGQTITRAGEYIDDHRSVDECDSTYHLTVIMENVYHFEDTVSICQGDSVLWRNHYYRIAGTYNEPFKTVDGQDSIYTLYLSVRNTYHVDVNIDLCEGQSYNYRGQEITTSTLINDTLQTIDGCDSICHLQIRVHQSFLNSDVLFLRSGDTLQWHGQEIVAAGTYYDRKKNVAGCDSVYEVLVEMYPDYLYEETVNICPKELPYQWRNGVEFGTAGTYFDRYTSTLGTDSIYVLHLNVLPTYLIDEHIEMCAGMDVQTHGMTISEPGLYYDSLLTYHGCDSVIRIYVTLAPTYYFIDTVYFNRDSQYEWQGHHKTLYQEGVYYDSLKTRETGCDSIYVLYLQYNPTYYVTTLDSICQNQLPYMYHGKEFWEDTTFVDTLLTIRGNDSICELRLTVLPSYTRIRRVELCEGDVYTYKGQTYTRDTIVYDTLHTAYGCDSVEIMRIEMAPSYHFFNTYSICYGEVYNWRNRSLTKPGVYHDSLHTVNAPFCDSIYTLTLTVYDPFFEMETVDTCLFDGETYLWQGHDHGRLFEASGIYYDSLKTVNGCDSVYALKLNVHRAYNFVEVIDFCDGDSAYYNNDTIVATRSFTDTLQTYDGCDSIRTLVYNFHPRYNFYEEHTICKDSTLLWHGQECYIEGLYFDHQTTVNGCDSFYTMQLFVNTRPVDSTVVFICPDSLPYWHVYEGDSVLLWRDTTIYYEFKTDKGCDSLYYFTLLLTDKCSPVDSIPLCPGDSFLYRDTWYNTPGNYSRWFNTDFTRNVPDSLYRFCLYTAPVYLVYDSVEVCAHELPYQYNDLTLWTSGHYFDSLQTVFGCDSVVDLAFVVKGAPITTIPIELCEGDVYHFRGKDYSDVGVFYDTLRCMDLCDSIFRIIINRAASHLFDERVEFVEGSTYYWSHDGSNPSGQSNGRPITLPGVYYDSLTTVSGCDSIYRLTAVVASRFYHFDSVVICQNALPYEWRGKTYYEGGLKYDSLKGYMGNDSVYALRLVVNPTYFHSEEIALCPGSSYFWQNRTITEAGVYWDTLRTNCDCDSVLRLIVNKGTTYTTDHHVTICPNSDDFRVAGRVVTVAGIYYDTLQTVLGCDSVIRYFVNVEDPFFHSEHATFNPGSTYAWHREGQAISLDKPGIYFDSCKSVSGCDSIYRLELTLNRSYHFYADTAICESRLPYEWRGQYLYTSDVYYDSLFTIHGLDSIYELEFAVLDAPRAKSKIEICEGDVYHFRGKDYSDVGVFYDTLKTVDLCDSIFQIVINRAPSYLIDERVEFVEGSTYLWSHDGSNPSGQSNGRPITLPGVYYDSLTSVSGCDSIYRLTAVVASRFYHFDSVVICQNALPYEWRGKTYYEGGLKYDSLKGYMGNDSVYALRLVVNPTYFHSESIELCPGTPYSWRNRTITEPGVYVDSMLTACNCDSVERLVVNMASTYMIERKVEICRNNSDFYLRGQLITEQGVYYDTLLTHAGCDSIFRYIVSFADYYYFDLKDSFNPGSKYKWHRDGQDIFLDQPGVYFDSCKTASGCDSIYRIELTMNRTYHFVQYADTCASELPYLWRGRQIDKAGNYFDSLQTLHGLDSVYELRLVVYSSPIRQEYVDMCQNDAYIFRNIRITKDTVLLDTMPSDHGCDSIVRYIIAFHPTYEREKNARIDGNSYYLFYGDTVRNAGVYYHHFESKFGCDSTIKLTLTVKPTYYKEESVTLCYEDAPYIYNNKQVWHDTIFVDTLRTKDGYDSICSFKIKIYDKIEETVVPVTICKGDSINIRNVYYSKSGNYYDTLFSALTGCDSIIHYVINYFDPIAETVVPVSICDGDTLSIHGMQIYEAGNFRDTLYSVVLGCDSIIHYVVNKLPTYHIFEQASFFENGTYTWKGHKDANGNDRIMRYPGQYYDSLMTVDGCDSIYYLQLDSKGVYDVDTLILVCQDELPYKHNGHYYYTDQEFTDTLKRFSGTGAGPLDGNYGGADSIVHYTYKITNKCSEYDIRYRCTNEILYIGSNAITKAGTYRLNIWSGSGMDSVARLHVVDAKTYAVHVYDTICQGDSVLFEGMVCRNTNVYRRAYQTIHGCDSSFYLHLYVYPSFHKRTDITYDTIADYQLPYPWHGRLYTETGTYYDTLNTVHGCDSVVTMRLRVYTTDTLRYNPVICKGQSYVFNGVTYTESTYIEEMSDYRKVGYSRCIIFNLLVVDTTRLIALTMDDDVCADETSITLTPTYTGAQPAEYSVTFLDKKARLEGFTDILNAPYTGSITIPMPLKPAGFFVSPGYYRIRVSLGNGNCAFEPLESEFLVRYPSSIMCQKWGDVVALYNESVNGNFSFSDYSWDVLGKNVHQEHSPYLYSSLLEPGDQVVVNLTRKGETQAIPSCPLTITYYSNPDGVPVLLAPSRVARTAPVTQLEATADGYYRIYDAMGHMVEEQNFYAGKQEVTLPAVSGFYLIRFHLENYANSDGFIPQEKQVIVERVLVY